MKTSNLSFVAVSFALCLILLGGCGAKESYLKYKAQLAERTKNYSECVSLFKEITEHNPKDDASLASLGHCYYHLEDCKSADTILTKAIEVNPSNDRAYDLRGLCKYKQKNYEEAIVDYEKALSINPKNPLTEIDLGDCYKNLGDKEKAKEHLIKAQQLYSDIGREKDIEKVKNALNELEKE